MDRNTGSLVVARQLDRETQSEYHLEVRALDTSAMNNPQSSAVTVRVDIDDVNDNPPKWAQDPITIPISESTPIGASVYNFTATDLDSGSNGDIRYGLVRQYPNDSIFSVDPLTGTLTLLKPVDYETLTEYTLIVVAMDQSSNVSERLSTTVTSQIQILDANDNSPVFVLPPTPNVVVSDLVTIGMPICHIVAVDLDSGENGRVTYQLLSGGDEFNVDYDTGVLTIVRLLTMQSFELNITASDHGVPVKQVTRVLKVIVQDSKLNPPRFLSAVYHANISEDAPPGSFVIRVTAKSSLPNGKFVLIQFPI